MALFVQTNTTWKEYTTASVSIPLYLSSHRGIPTVLIHGIATAWMTFGMVLNGFLIYYLVLANKYRSPVFMLVLFLAISDFGVCFSMACFATFVWPIYRLPTSTWLVCKIIFYLNSITAPTSPYYLVLFAALRFYQLCFPLKARARVTSAFVRNWCLVIACVTMVIWSPSLFSFNLVDVNYDSSYSVICTYTGNFMPLRSMVYLVVNTCIPAISIFVLHLLKYIGVSLRQSGIEGKLERKNTDIRALVIVIAMFYMTWIPINVYGIMHTYPHSHAPYQDRLWLLLVYFNGSNNVLNPVVYCLAANSVRIDIVRLIRQMKYKKTA